MPLYYRLTRANNGRSSFVTSDLESVAAEVDIANGAEAGDRFVVEIVEMTESEVDALPEFDGF